MRARGSRLAAALVGHLLLASSSHAAESVEEFYKRSNQVSILIGFASGTSYGTWARIVGRHMSKYLPGHPNFIVREMPGAGSLIMANYLHGRAPKDGSVIGSFSRNLPSQAMFGLDNARFDPREFGYIGSPERQPTVVCASTAESGVTSVEELRKTELLVGGTGATVGSSFLPAIVNQLARTRFKVVEGYQSPAEVYLAIRRGEVSGICTGYSDLYAANRDLLDSGKLTFLFNFENRRDPLLNGAPSIFEYVDDLESRQILALTNSSTELGRPYAAPPGIPEERLAALRAAFDNAMRDPELIHEAAIAHLEAGLITGAELQDAVNALYLIPAPIVEKVKAMLPKESAGPR